MLMSATRLRRWRRPFVVSILAILLIVGHYLFWYRPRARDARPTTSSLAGRLGLADQGLPLRLWLPFPHQNLAALEDHFGANPRLSQALAEYTGVELSEVPSFGPFRVPPSRELLIASDESRERLLIVIRMYPSIRWLLRAAGYVAGNEWLTGGRLRVGDREMSVRWQGPDWIATTEAEDVQATAATVVDREVFALFRYPEMFEWMPANLVSLEIPGENLRIASVDKSFQTQPLRKRTAIGEAALLSVRLGAGTPPSKIDALALFAPAEDSSAGVPGATVAHSGSEDRWSLPAERLLSAIGVQVVATQQGDWTFWSFDDRSLARASQLLPVIEALRERAEREEASMVGEVDLERARRAVRLIDGVVAAIPIIGRDEARRWQLFSTLVDLGQDYSRVSFRIGETPDKLEVVVE